MPRCKRCGRQLTDPESIARDYGPTCWRRRSPDEQLTLQMDKPSRVFRWDMTHKEMHQAVCRVIFKRGE